MYGPPPSPSQIDLAVSPWTTLLCIALGILITSTARIRALSPRTKAWLFCFGQTLMLTAPLGLMISQGVYGDYPTIDKAGSYFYYQDGVHIRSLLHPIQSLDDCAVQLIGVHMGHLWLTQFFDLFLSGYGPFNAQALLMPALAWWTAALFFRELGADWRGAISLALPYGLTLHIFRDLNWYTIEKSAIFLLPAYAFLLLRSHRRGGSWIVLSALCFVSAAWINWYLALVAAAGAGTAALIARSANLWRAVLLSAALLMPLVAYQLALVSRGSPGDPQAFLELRASMDHFSLVPLEWNRLEWWAALSPVALGLLLHRLLREPLENVDRVLLLVSCVLFVFSLGPNLIGELSNPIYMVAWHTVPGFWRVAKPEVFFYGSWLCMLGVASRGALSRKRVVYPALLLTWVLLTRPHETYPGFTEEIPLQPALCTQALPTGTQAP
ncbi:MAG: hypothetical protein VXW32_08175 [Myxococcota bacterium]|nr:hypothetical protein [Myxococcota bacterium]